MRRVWNVVIALAGSGGCFLTGCDRAASSGARVDMPMMSGADGSEWHEQYTFGVLDTPESHVLGHVRNVVVDGTGRLLVLDELRKEVLVVGNGGELEAVLGGRGDGPGELHSPVAVGVAAPDALIVVDRERAVLQRLSISGAWEGDRIQVPFTPNAACVADGRLFMLGFVDPAVIHEADPSTGEILASFESSSIDGLLEDSTMVGLTRATEAASGRLYCADGSPRILHAPERLGWVRSYKFDGTLEWDVSLAGFAEPVRTEAGRGVRFDIDRELGYTSSVTRVATAGPDFVAIRLEHAFPRSVGKEPIGETVFLTSNLGEEVERTSGDQEIVAASAGVVVTLLQDPYPVITLWER